MKKFLRTLLAVICALIIINVVGFVLFFGVVGALSSGSDTPVIPNSGVLKIDMSKIAVSDSPVSDDPFAALSSGNNASPISLRDAVRAINAASEDPAVKYIYLKPDGASMGTASIQEFRTALKNFKDKAVISYTETPSTGSYYLASVSDKIYMTSAQGATTTIVGLSGRLMFLKDLLDKFGIHVQLIRHGKYKSAGEMYIRNSASEANLEQNRAMINSMWNTFVTDMAEGRGLTVQAVNKAVDNLDLCIPEDFLRLGFVDELLDRHGLEQKLADLAVVDDYKKIKFIAFKDYVKARVTPQVAVGKDQIAVIYADGEIIDGSDTRNVAGERFASIIESVCADSTVKAVVLRVNSPGGSVLASEKIKTELDRMKQYKPIVASYGDYAASGGYWISNNCDKIYADAATLTGSIGVFSMVPEFSGTLKDVAHVNVTQVNSNKHSDMFSLVRPFNEAELAYMQRSVEVIYDRFVQTVSQGRGLEPDYVDSIAQGRVWTGAEALEIGLVDELGTLEDALLYTRSLIENGDMAVVKEYPSAVSSFDEIIKSLSGSSDTDDYSIRAFNNWYKDWQKGKVNCTFARLPYVMINF